MGQAKQRGTYIQRRQSAIAKRLKGVVSSSMLNQSYNENKSHIPINTLQKTMMMSAILSLGTLSPRLHNPLHVHK